MCSRNTDLAAESDNVAENDISNIEQNVPAKKAHLAAESDNVAESQKPNLKSEY